MRKNKKAILSLALAASLFLSGATSHAAFSAGQKITKFKYNSKNGTVSVMADVDGSSAGTYYKYKGEINYASAAKLNIYVEDITCLTVLIVLLQMRKQLQVKSQQQYMHMYREEKLAYPPKNIQVLQLDI